MATCNKSTSIGSVNYLEPDNERISSDAHQLASGTLKLDDYPPIRELERLKSDGDRALQSAHFPTPREKQLAEGLQRNTNGWIDTAKDVLSVAVDVNGLVTTCAPAIKTGILTSDDVVRATQHALSMQETLKRIYYRSCDMAVNNSNDLLLAIDNDEKTSLDSTVTTAADEHRNDLKKFQHGEVNVNVPYQSHSKLLESLKRAEPNEKSRVRQAGEQSSRAWEIAKSLGMIVLTVGIIIGFAILKR